MVRINSLLKLLGVVALAAISISSFSNIALSRPEYAAREKKDCTFCHTATPSAQTLNKAGRYYRTHGYSLKGYRDSAETATSAASSTQAAPAEKITKATLGETEGQVLGNNLVTGTIEIGGRFRDVDGNRDVYRSVVNLGSGLRLMNLSSELRSLDNTGVLFDKISVNASNWGDPYNTAKLRVEKRGLYHFDYSYRTIDYFNFIPSFSNPLFDSGVLVGQHSFDIKRRQSDFRLDLFPNRRVKPFAGYSRNTSFGPALTTLNAGGDEFVVNRILQDEANEYYFGTEFRSSRLDIGFEQGLRFYKDDQQAFLTAPSQGNDPQPAFRGMFPNAQQIFLNFFNRDYRLRSFIPTSRFAVDLRAARWLKLTSRLSYSETDVTFDRSQIFTGNTFILNSLFRYVGSDGELSRSVVGRPNTVSDTTATVQPIKRLKFTETLRFNQFDIAGASVLTTTLALGLDPFFGPPPSPAFRSVDLFDRRTTYKSYLNQVEVSYSLTDRMNVRAGYRYTMREVLRRIGANNDIVLEPTEQRTDTFLSSFSYRPSRGSRFFAEYENGAYENIFTGTEPIDYQRLRIRGQHSIGSWLILAGSYLLQDSANPNRLFVNDVNNRGVSASVTWVPSERFNLDLNYSLTDVDATINIVGQSTGGRVRTFFIANDNFIQTNLNVSLTSRLGAALGYSLVSTSGTFPINYHQPRLHLSYRFWRGVSWNIGWQYYRYDEKVTTRVQDYRANLLSTSMKFSF